MTWDDLRGRVTTLLDRIVNDEKTPLMIRQVASITMQGLMLMSIMNNSHQRKTASFAECLTKTEELEKQYEDVVDQVSSM